MAKKPKVITKQQFARWSPEHQARALADRRTRMRIETAALPEEWRKKREAAQFNRTPITEGSATTYGDLAKQRAYMEPLTFGEGDRQLQDRTSNLAAARQRDADWFAQYRRDVQAAQDRAVGAQTAAIEGNKQLIDSANQVSVSSRDAIVRQLQDRAAQLGQTSQAADYQALADQAASARAASLANTAQRQVSDANTTVGSATNQVGVAGLKDLEAQGYRNRQESALNQDKRDYGTKKDAWRAKFIEDAIAEARKQVLEDKAYGLKVTQAQTAAEAKAKQLALQGKNAETSRRSQEETARHNRAMENKSSSRGGGRSSGSGPKPATPKETRTQASAIRRAIVLIKGYKAQGTSTGKIRQGLAVKGIDADVVNTAMDIVYLGGIGKVNRRRWKKAGYNPRDFGQPFK